MEYSTIICNAARDGNLKRLKVFLDCRKEQELRTLLSTSTCGTPPLVIAARNGHLSVCEYLISKGGDVEVSGSVTFEGENIEGARALWCAAAAGHSEVVKFLVAHGANVNNTTITNSTPLRAACFDGHLEIVRHLVEHGADMEVANKHGHTSLMIACYKGHTEVVKYLISKGAEINRKSIKGNTALHDCAESGSLDILKLLLLSGARMEADAFGLTPLLTAASVGHGVIVDFLVQNPCVPMQERVDALELLGAHFVDKKRDIIGAVQYWKRALFMRRLYNCWHQVNTESTSEDTTSTGGDGVGNVGVEGTSWGSSVSRVRGGSGGDHSCGFDSGVPSEIPCFTYESTASGVVRSEQSLPRSPYRKLKPKTALPCAAYKYQREVETIEELEAIRSDPDAIRMQALLIRERVLGPAHPDTCYYIRFRGAVYADIGNCQRCIELWLYALDIQQLVLDPLSHLTLSSFISFAELFSFMLNDSFAQQRQLMENADEEDPVINMDGGPVPALAAAGGQGGPVSRRPANGGRRCPVQFDDIMTVLERILNEVRRGLEFFANNSVVYSTNRKLLDKDKETAAMANIHRLCLITLHLICQICRLESQMSSEEEFRLKQTVYKLVQLDPRGDQGASLLHLACSAESTTIGNYPVCRFPALNVVQMLLYVGADVSATDHSGNTPLHTVLHNQIGRPSIVRCLLEAGGHIDRKNHVGKTPVDAIKQSTCDVGPMNYITLKCLAAQAVKSLGIVYNRGQIPKCLESFVEMH